ncbi:DUF4089 domain-containing protein [Bosea sp. TAF32]|uniref:DUF4089 domain-containing protein n=1 Tax=Bosea sp. TAF32 TaxID=3237482 RepID=UPI003F902498
MKTADNSPGGFDPARHLEVMAPTLGLAISEAQKPVVLQFLTIAHNMARIVDATPLADDRLELAPNFRPGLPGGGR